MYSDSIKIAVRMLYCVYCLYLDCLSKDDVDKIIVMVNKFVTSH